MGGKINELERARRAIFAKMPEALQEEVQQMEKLETKGNQTAVLTAWSLGYHVKTIHENEATYGSQAIEKAARYLGRSDAALRNRMKLVVAFPKREFVQSYSQRQMRDGNYLSLDHWLALSRVREEERRLRLLEETMQESWTARGLRNYCKSQGTAGKGGRRPGVPETIGSQLQKGFELAQKLSNYVPHILDTTLPAIQAAGPDQLTRQLKAQMQTMIKACVAAGRSMVSTIKGLKRAMERVDKVLHEKKQQSAVAPSTNGHSVNGNGRTKHGSRTAQRAAAAG